MANLKLWLAFGKRRKPEDPRHWILILISEGEDKGTYFHVTGGPTQGIPYSVQIQGNKRFYSHGLDEHHFIGEIDEKDRKKVTSSARKFEPQRCQEWAVRVLGDLERKGLIQRGTCDYWFNQVENSPYSTDGVHGIDNNATSTAGPSSSGISTTQAEGLQETTGSSQWVWDEKRQEYRYWDAVSGRWIWQSQCSQ